MLNDKVVDWVSMNLSHVATASAFDLFLSQQAGSTIPYKLGSSWDSGLDFGRISTFFGSGVYLMTVDCRGELSQFKSG